MVWSGIIWSQNVIPGGEAAVVPAQVQPHQQEVVGVDLEQVLTVLAYQH